MSGDEEDNAADKEKEGDKSNRSNIESNLEKINKINLKPSLSRHVEQELSEGYQYIIGLDEAGRGPLGKVITLRHVVQLIVYI